MSGGPHVGVRRCRRAANLFAIAALKGDHLRAGSKGDCDMRLPIIPPAELSSEQKPLYDDMREGIARNFQGFINVRDDGALLGPWNPWIHEPRFGKPSGNLQRRWYRNHRFRLPWEKW